MEGPGGEKEYKHSGWTFPYWNDEIAGFKYDELFASDAHLLDRGHIRVLPLPGPPKRMNRFSP